MPGAMHRMGVYLGLVEEDEYAETDGYGPASERTPARREEYATHGAHADSQYARGAHADSHSSARGEPAEMTRYSREYDEAPTGVAYDNEYPAQPTYQITALHPRTYNEARTIGEHFRKSTPVIMNLSEMDDADAKRLVDFAAGLTFGLHGRIERVTAKVFLLSPHNVSVTAQDKAKIENGFFNQS
ncbi:cell division protein SepF [uncultured Jatrophihabitans sp.]|uniref:cell division protein SepF n=1 Tax=uncultured Jatrophihabitans sp. TaxID=1610747 RepID=UPI0035CCA7E5